MKRRLVMQLGLAACSGPVLALNSRQKTRIFMLLGRGVGDSERGFMDYLTQAGYNLEVSVRDTAGNTALLPEFVREMKRQRPDLVYAWGTPQTIAVVGRYDDIDPQLHISDIPVVFAYVASPVDAMLTRDLSRSNRNFTGVIHIPAAQSQVRTLLAYKSCRHIGSVFNPLEPNSLIALSAIEKELAARSVQLTKLPVKLDPDGKPVAASIIEHLHSLKRQQVDFMYLGPDTFVAGLNRARVAATALELKIPSFSVTEPIVRENGGLFALASRGYSVGQFAGFKAHQVLSGERPIGEIPMETLRRFSVLLNIGTARGIGSYPSLELLRFAEIVQS